MGTPTDKSVELLSHLTAKTVERGYGCRIIHVGNRPKEALAFLNDLRSLISDVVLINTDLSPVEIERICGGMICCDVIAGSRSQPLDPEVRDAWNALDDLSEAKPKQNFAPLEDMSMQLPASAYGSPSLSMSHGIFGRWSSFDLTSFGLRANTSSRMNRELGGSLMSIVQRFDIQKSPTPRATDPTAILLEKLALAPEVCASPAWEKLKGNHDLSLLATLVVRALGQTKSIGLQPMLRRLVEQMVLDPAFSRRVFDLLHDANASCIDRVSLSLNRVGMELLALPAFQGALNDDPHAVVDIGRKVFRRNCIDRLADAKVKAINAEREAQGLSSHGEEIETHLAYFEGLHESLDLGGEKPDAQFAKSNFSGVNSEDIQGARIAVLQEEEQGFAGFLATWRPWQDALRKLLPYEVAEIEKLADPEHWAPFIQEATEQVKKDGIPFEFHHEAITRALNQRAHEELNRLWLALTQQALSKLDVH